VVNFASHSAVVEADISVSDVQAVVEKLGYHAFPQETALEREKREKREQHAAQRRVVLALALAVPVIVLGMVHSLAHDVNVRWLGLALTGLLLLFPGRVFFINAFRLLRQKTANMDTLVSLGAGLSYLWSVFQVFTEGTHVYFETAAAIVAFVLVGKYVEQRMTWRATSSLGALLRLQPSFVQRLTGAESGGQDEQVDVRFLRTGDLLRARVGERFAADGVIVEGQTEADESLLTGESLPVVKRSGDKVAAGALNLTSAVLYRAEAVGPASRLGEIVAFVERTQLSKAPIQKLADRVSAVFVPVILSLSVLTFLVWKFLLQSDGFNSLNAAVSVMVVACPCALGLATPIAVAIATTRAARMGLLFRDLSALEALQEVHTLVVDKTGTLTTGQLSVVAERIVSTQPLPDALLTSVLELERSSQHPVALAIVSWLEKRATGAVGAPLKNQRELIGKGVQAEVDDGGNTHQLFIGSASELERKLLAENDLLAENETVSWVVCRWDGAPLLAFALQDSLRSDAKSVLDELRTAGIHTVLLSGDRTSVVTSVATHLGIQAQGEQSPQMKAEFIAQLQKEGKRVAMLGDGVNDAPALARADVGIAMGSGTDAAQSTAGITLKDAQLSGVLTAVRLSRATFKNIRQNLAWAFGYNVLLIPLAMAGKLTPMWAAAAMAFSSVFVVLNALRLLQFGKQVRAS
ncbi:MAG: hypothetical protein RIR26_557, partial [Pseudomonadota bacterium]